MTTYRERHLAGLYGEAQAEASPQSDLDSMTKDELLAHAQSIGAKPANAAMTKDEIRASIDNA